MRRRRQFREEWRLERERWRAAALEARRRHHAHHGHHHPRHLGPDHPLAPWWMRLRMRVFLGYGASLVVGVWLGHRLAADEARWWQIALIVLGVWMVAGAVAWRLTRPLLVTIRAARELGEGRLDTRIPVPPHDDELAILAGALNRMAEQIGQQLRDQRALLAAVSHELRTPLGHMRVLIETAREQRDEPALAQLEREVLALDDLVAKLLASSRLEFGSLDRRLLDVGALVADVALAAGVPAERIVADGDTTAAIDPTLVRRAVANLVDNAARHGGGAVAIRVERRAAQVAIEVDDAGPGMAAGDVEATRGFVPSTGGGLGLGLTLVARIAAAHDGKAWSEPRPGGGARVGLSVGVVASAP